MDDYRDFSLSPWLTMTLLDPKYSAHLINEGAENQGHRKLKTTNRRGLSPPLSLHWGRVMGDSVETTVTGR